MVDGYNELTRIYRENSSSPLNVIFEKMEEFFVRAGEDFRRGLITEEEFYISTNPETLVSTMLNDKGIDVYAGTVNEHGDFAETYEEWKRTGRITSRQWMYESISPTDDVTRNAEILFKILDALKVPLASFITLKLENKEDFPPIYLGETPNTIYLFARGCCTNISQLKADADPVGKEYMLNIEFFNPITDNPYKTTARFMVDTVREDYYKGKGLIKDFMAQEGEIEIEIRKNFDFFTFGSKTVTRMQKLFRTYVLPIPVTKWLTWEKARLQKSYEVEAEYKTLRLPYLIGSDEAGRRKPQDGNIYRIH